MVGLLVDGRRTWRKPLLTLCGCYTVLPCIFLWFQKSRSVVAEAVHADGTGGAQAAFPVAARRKCAYCWRPVSSVWRW
ncbi:hypothetical protein DVU_3040 [Nitratidesulfovibrio vulgaris str. Hildenborough]|uniref:Uncharacterized protein n=1 Tax=Nitratidesulfovibrio vulgaris (strain ATCC 29579 / DSM 644 / CCUG 34227 / NCIMB 8303 / VKM B-1760 / Hildenborough) TaxID=882 RepID=Q726R6_NITV2|nr:hypothetical protein DVU_3040 [Nitratidesulfovibrio vulgaris str. Hildenborough]